tara:strand:+ start:29602 stop:30018 length:417 start_codon:yes stop_codon:yes gene_type:complete
MFKPGSASKRNLDGVHPDLVEVVMLAYRLSKVDFSVVDGLRDIITQKRYVRTGVSQTMDSKHLEQKDGFSHAVDLYPWVNGKTNHDEKYYLMVCKAVHEAANRLKVRVTLGCFWTSFQQNSNGVIEYGDKCHVELWSD